MQLRDLGVDHGGIHPAVRAGRHRDLVLAVAIDDDQRDASLLFVELTTGGRVDSRLVQAGQGDPAEVIAPDSAQQRDRGSDPTGRYGLVGALATVLAHESVADHRLTRGGKTLDANDQIDVDRPSDDNDWIGTGHLTQAHLPPVVLTLSPRRERNRLRERILHAMDVSIEAPGRANRRSR